MRSIPVGDLLLDLDNPRHAHMQSQREAIQALLEDPRTIKLAEDISKNGLSPIDPLLVMKRGSSYVVLEGNRRLASLRVLNNPDLAKGMKHEKDLRRYAKEGADNIPTEAECWVASSRDDGRQWIRLRHIGQAGGVGVVPWGARERQRFEFDPESHAGKGSVFIDTVLKAYPKNAALKADLETIETDRITTLGRMVKEPEFRRRLGLKEADGRFVSHYPAELLEDVIERIARDLATKLTVTNIKTKDQRIEYLDKLTFPPDDARRDDAQPRVEGSVSAALKKKARKIVVKPGPIFKDLNVKKLGTRLPVILEEIRHLDPDRFPNAVAAMIRVVLEIAVDQTYERKKWSGDKLATRVKKCLHLVDPSDELELYQEIRIGLSDPNSVYSVATLHAYLHNPHFHPTPTQLRSVAANITPFVRALDGLG